MAKPPKTEPGKQYPVITCRECGHVDRVASIPADQEGQAYESFLSQCSKCQVIQRVQLSEIQYGLAHRKH